MKTLVIGATGQVGHELARQIPSGLIATTRSGESPFAGVSCLALDVTDLDAISALIARVEPGLVVNASAYTAVDRAESEAELAFRVNAQAPESMARACADVGARFVHYSTDYVFDGDGREPYRPDDPTAPIGVYGRSKREGEERVLASGADAMILRTAWVYGLRGQNFLRTMLRLGGERDELRVVDDQIGSPTPAWLVAALTRELVARGAPAGIQHVIARGAVSWCGFARAIFDEATARGLLARAPRVEAIPSSEYPTPAKRPSYSVLDTSGLAALGIDVPAWRDALAETFMRDVGAGASALG
ncbi:dTDP-4-dehydrorhamnose reductase [Cognatilysobacter segetis]|uniref:dTDP-4-dehydrorhamnose reductase n=1 Tax=Cognatilysobacter segetis TaxID=2492394 RepID=UPI00105D220E|nr:dTDP-4-dehydrorhamnose reductase [Lysobacter segetis]